MSRLAAVDVHFDYGEHAVLAGAALMLEPGSLTLLAGCNGAGKSTLLGLLAGIRKPTSGHVRLDDRNILDVPTTERARTVTLIPQDSDTSFEFTGREIVMMGRHPHISRFGSPDQTDRAAVDAALGMTDATHFADRSIRTLSGGELRRIHIARALATHAPILLADEPTSNLDLEHAVAILELLRGLADDGQAVLLSSHDLNLIAPRCDRVALLHERRIDRVGPPAEVLDDATLAAVFRVRSRPPEGGFPRGFESL